MPDHRPILIVDDSDDDVVLLKRAFRLCKIEHPLKNFATAEQALAYLQEAGDDLPEAIFLDLRLPDMDGFGFLREIKQHMRWRIIPVITLSGSMNPKDSARSRELGAMSFLEKPVDVAELCKIIDAVARYWLPQ